ncbi:MAG: hypothetical protein P8N09_10035 [Planctomycetota bacterium]|jgi:hypothetical protein|nr:hypothetical protein [Planctomycetota bacterium]
MAASDEAGYIDRWGTPLLSGLVFLMVAGLLFVARDAARASPRFWVDPAQVAVLERPEWMPPDLAVQLAVELGISLGEPALLLGDQDLSRWRGDLLDASDWVESVERLESQFPGRAAVRLQLRRPVLELAGQLLLSAGGHTLGRGYIETEPRPLRFEGVGDPQEVRECAASAADILPYRPELEELGVVLEKVSLGSGGRVRFVTTTGVEIEWGRSSTRSEFSVVDVPPSARVRHLQAALERRPGLHGVSRVILWKDQPEIQLASPALPVGGRPGGG